MKWCKGDTRLLYCKLFEMLHGGVNVDYQACARRSNIEIDICMGAQEDADIIICVAVYLRGFPLVVQRRRWL